MDLIFKEVIDNVTVIPKECYRESGEIDGVKLFLWFCPGLAQEEAEILNKKADCEMLPINKNAMINFIKRELPLIRK